MGPAPIASISQPSNSRPREPFRIRSIASLPFSGEKNTTLLQALIRANSKFPLLDACPLSDPDVQQAITNLQLAVTDLQQQRLLLNALNGHASQQVQDLAG